jgi:2-hydroxychromene-2-carboxylate isomerase
MSHKTLEFHFDFVSPASYLAYTQVERIAQEAGATLVWHPMLLGGVFNASPVSVPAKGRWVQADMVRWAKRWGVPFALNPHFPIQTLTLMRGACGLLLRQPEQFRRYVDAVFHAIWVTPRNLNEPTEVQAMLTDAGFDAQALLALAGEPEVKADLVARTELSVQRGAFGAPTFFVGQQLFFGQDRLDFVAEALKD